MSVTFYNFQKLHDEEFRSEVKAEFAKIVDSNGFIEGEYNARFENDFAKMQNTKHCLLVANGTDAIEIALQAYGVGQGDVVGIPSISFYATAEAVYNVGATAVFIDVDPMTGLMCPDSLARVADQHEMKAIIPVHIYGLPAPMLELEKICREKDIRIVEDSAQAQGTFIAPGEPVGSTNNLVTFSFYPTKNLGAFGDAGAVLTQDDELAEEIKSIRNHGRSPFGHRLIGRNSRCDTLQACVLQLKLKKVEEYNKRRKEIAKRYHELLRDLPLRLVPDKFLDLSSWHLYPVGLADESQKMALKEKLAKESIGSALFYEKSLPDEAPLKDVPGEKENGRNFAKTTLCLPMHPFLEEADLQRVKEEISKLL